MRRSKNFIAPREIGSKALNVKATPIPGKEWWDPYFDPIFDELEKTNTPIIFHDTKTGSMGQERFADNFFFSHMVGRTIESMVCLMVYLCGGVMEKHPDLKIICLETGASQMPWWLSRMDEHWEKLPHLVPWQKRRPSDIFNQSVYVGCEPFEDGLFEWAVEYLGGDRLVLATDSPHWDSSQPGQVTGPVAKSTKISQENKRKVLGENAINLLRFEVFSDIRSSGGLKRTYLMVRLLTGLIVLLVLFLVTQNSWSAATDKQVVIAYAAMNARVAPLWVARDRGFFAKYGVTADTIFVRGAPTLVAAMQANEIDVGYTGGTAVVGAVANGADLKVLAAFTNRVTYDLMVKPGIKTPEDLRGKKFGIQAIGGTVWMGAMSSVRTS